MTGPADGRGELEHALRTTSTLSMSSPARLTKLD
jgi:hypothetical protein